MADFDPVEIEINLKQNVSEESGKVTQGMDAMSDATKRLQEQVEAQKKVISGLEKEYEKAKKAFESIDIDLADNTDYSELFGQNKAYLEEVTESLSSAKEELGFIEAAQRKVVTGASDIKREAENVVTGWNEIAGSMPELASAFEFQKKHLKDLNAELITLKDSIKQKEGVLGSIQDDSPYNKRRIELQEEIKELKIRSKEVQYSIKDEEQGLKSLTKQYDTLKKEQEKLAQQQQAAANKQVTTLQQIRQVTEEMRLLRGADGIVAPENIQRYDQLKQKLSELGTSYRIVQQEQKTLTMAGNAQFAGMIQGMSGLAGVFSTVQGAAGLLAKNNENLTAIQTKLQAAMAITYGLQQASNVLHSTSSFRINTVTKATQLWTGATNRLAISLGGSRIAAQALMATLTLGLSVAITGVIYLISKYSSEQEKAAENTQKFNEASASSASKNRAEFERLRQQWVAAGDDLKKKEKLVRDNIDAYNSFGAKINDVNDADKMFVGNADNFVASINKRAMSVAAMELASEKYKEAMQKMLDAESRPNNPTFWDKTKGYMSWFGLQQSGNKNSSWNDMTKGWAEKAGKDQQKEAERAGQEAVKFTEMALGYDDASRKAIEESGLKASTDIIEGSKDHWQKIREAQQKIMDGSLPESSDFTRAKSLRDNADKMLEKWNKTNFKSIESAKERAAKKAETEQKRRDKANESLLRKSASYEEKIAASRIAAMRDGAEKQRTAIQAEYDKEKALIERELRELADIEKITGKPATEQRNLLIEFDTAATDEYEAKIALLDEVSKKAIQDIFDDVNQKFSSELDSNLTQINRYYDAQIKKAQEAGASIEQINSLRTDRERETSQAKLDAQMKEIDFETEIALRRENISKKYYVLEADRQMALLKIQQEAARKTLDILKQKYDKTPTKELERDIQSATVALEEFDEQERSLKLQKLKQAADYVADVARTLNSLFEDDGAFGNETLSQITDTVGSIAQGFATGGIAGGAMAAASQAINLINSAAAAEKRHQEALKVLQQTKIAMQREYLQLLLEEQMKYKEGTSIFGTDTIGKVVNAIDVYRKSIKGYNEELQGNFKPNEAYEEKLEKQASRGGLLSKYYSQKLTDYQRQAELYTKGAAALANAEIVTGHKKTGLFGWGKGKDTYSKIVDVYDDILDAEGKLNRERVQAILDTQKMTDETRTYLQTLLGLEDQAVAAQEEMRSLLEGTFGSLGDSLATAIVDAFASGDDALLKFKDNVTDVLNGFATQMVYSLFLSKMFSELQTDIEGVYNKLADGTISEQDLSNQVTDMLGDFFGGLGGTVDQANAFLEKFWERAEAAGFDSPTGDRSVSSGKGLAQASQDSINELNGGVYSVMQQVGDIRNMKRESMVILKAYQKAIDRIAENTEYCRQIPDLIESIEDMKRKGLKMRTA